MTRPLLVALPLAAVLGLASAGLGAMHFFVLEHGTPDRLVSVYSAAAAQGDLESLAALAPPGKLQSEVLTLGGAWHSRVEDALRHAATAGALRAYQIHLRYEEAKGAARSDYFDIPWRDRPDDRDRWIHDHAVATLTEADQALVYVDDDGDGRTYWNDVATAGYGDWRALGYSARRNLEGAGKQADFLAEQGAWELPLPQRRVLVGLGLDQLEVDDQLVLTDTDFDAWSQRAAFVESNGTQLLAGVYRTAYAPPGLASREVQRSEPEGLLYRPGSAVVSGSGPAVELWGLAMRPEGSWRWSTLNDLELESVVEQLQGREGAQAFARLTSDGGVQ